MRPVALIVLVTLLAVPLSLAIPSAVAHHSQPDSVTEVSEVASGTGVTWRSVAFAPDGSHALLVGRVTAGDQVRDVIGRWAPGAGVEIVYNRSGAGLVDVAFHESGTSLVVGLRNTVLLGEPGSYRNVWNDSSYADQDLTFYGLRGDLRPGSPWGLVAGSSLLKVHLNGSIEVVHGGRGAFFRAMDWNPAAGLSDPFAWVEAAIDRGGRAILGTIWRTNGTPPLSEDDNIALYGRSNPGRALLNTIAFAPNGTFALMAGRDGPGASFLTWAAARMACHTHEGEDGCHDHRWQYLPVQKTTGAVTCIDWHPSGRYALVVGLEEDVVGYVGEHVHTPLLHRGPDLFGCAFDPSGDRALAVGEDGTVFEVLPGLGPLAGVIQPDAGSLMAPKEDATFVVATMPRMAGDDVAVSAHVVGTQLQADVENKDRWWRLTVDVSDLPDGTHTLRVSANGTRGSMVLDHPFLVNNEAFKPEPPTIRSPSNLEGSGSDSDGLFTIRWDPIEAPVVYEVHQSRSDGGGNASRILQAGSSSNLTVRVDADGSYLYRVRAKNAFNVSDWSQAVVVNVILDSDGDGVPDSKDPRPYVADTWGDTDGDGVADDQEYRQCSDPNDPNSTPATDDDGDGLRNGEECLQGTDPKDPDDPPADPGPGTDPGDGDGTGDPGPGDDGDPIPAVGLLALIPCLAAAALASKR